MDRWASVSSWRFAIIISSFTYQVVTSTPIISVQYTDTSTGSPTRWLWNFGDGQSSDLQNPLHIYQVAGFYNVTLTAYIPSDEQFPSKNPVSALRKSGRAATNALAFLAFTSASFSSADPFEFNTFSLDRFATFDFEYFTRTITYNPDLSAHIGRIILLMMAFESLPTLPFSGSKIDLGGVLRIPPDGDSLIVADISSLAGSTPTFQIEDFFDLALLPSPDVGNASGWAEQILFLKSIGISQGDSVTEEVNVLVDWCGMGWILLTRRIDDISPLEKNLVLTTDKPVHLTGKYSVDRPNKNVIWREKYGMPYRCYPHYDISINGNIEQLEPSDTIVHTFPIQDMAESPTLNIIFIGTQCGDLVASSSPLIEIDSVLA